MTILYKNKKGINFLFNKYNKGDLTNGYVNI